MVAWCMVAWCVVAGRVVRGGSCGDGGRRVRSTNGPRQVEVQGAGRLHSDPLAPLKAVFQRHAAFERLFKGGVVGVGVVVW